MHPDDIYIKNKKKGKQSTTGGKIVAPTQGQRYALGKLLASSGRTVNMEEISKGEASMLINFLSGLRPINTIFDRVNRALPLGNGKGNSNV